MTGRWVHRFDTGPVSDAHTAHEVLVIDASTYAGSLATLALVIDSPRIAVPPHRHQCCAGAGIGVAEFRPAWTSNLAAESHVDRLLDPPDAVIANLVGATDRLGIGAEVTSGRIDTRKHELEDRTGMPCLARCSEMLGLRAFEYE